MANSGMTLEEDIASKVEKAQEFKTKGNNYFKEKHYKKALLQYHSALMYLKGVECDIHPPFPNVGKRVNLPAEKISIIDNLNADLQNNLAACLLKQSPVRSDRVVECCLKVLERQPANAKAHYRMSLAYYNDKDLAKAKEALTKADEIAKGQDSAVRSLSIEIESGLKAEETACRNMYKDSLLKDSFK